MVEPTYPEVISGPNTQNILINRLTFGRGENLVLTTNGQQGNAQRVFAASYMTTGEARKHIIDEVKEKQISEEKIRAHSRQKSLFKYNMHKPSSNLIDVLLKLNKPKHVKERSLHANSNNRSRVATV